MRINHNIPALQALFQYNKTNMGLEKALEKLSSGKRINRAADDAAGMAISNKLDAQIRGLEQANRNANDGISLIQTAEGALNEVQSMVQRMRELAVQASNGTLAPEDRDAIQKEINQLTEEVLRVSNEVEFNEMTLLNGDLDRVNFTKTDPATANAEIYSMTDEVPSGEYELSLGASPTIVTGSKFGTGQINETGTLTIDGKSITIALADTVDSIAGKINGLVGITVDAKSGADKNQLSITNLANGDLGITITATNANILTKLGLDATTAHVSKGCGDGEVALRKDFPSDATYTIGADNMIEIKDDKGFKLVVESDSMPAAGNPAVKVNMDILDVGPLSIHIGANEGQNMEVRIPNMSPKALGIDKLDMSSTTTANEALGKIDDAINKISLVRAQLGAYQNRLEYTENNLTTATENMTASLSRIVDVDMAVEMANYTQLNVISQSGVSMIAQANQRPEQVLQLLRG